MTSKPLHQFLLRTDIDYVIPPGKICNHHVAFDSTLISCTYLGSHKFEVGRDESGREPWPAGQT